MFAFIRYNFIIFFDAKRWCRWRRICNNTMKWWILNSMRIIILQWCVRWLRHRNERIINWLRRKIVRFIFFLRLIKAWQLHTGVQEHACSGLRYRVVSIATILSAVSAPWKNGSSLKFTFVYHLLHTRASTKYACLSRWKHRVPTLNLNLWPDFSCWTAHITHTHTMTTHTKSASSMHKRVFTDN